MSLESNYNIDVEIYRESRDTKFQPNIVWTLLKTVRGLKDLFRGDERFSDDGKTVVADYRFYINYTDVKLVDRLKEDDDIYEIVKIHNPNMRNHHLEIMAKLMPNGTDGAMQIDS